MLLNCLNATNYYKSNDLMKEYLKQLQTSRNELSSIISSSSQLGALSKNQTSEQLTSESLTFPFPIPSLFMPDLTHTSNIIPSESQTEIRQPAKENRDYYPPKNNVSSTDIVPTNTTNDGRKRLHSQSISYSLPNPVFQAPKYAVIPLQSSKYLPSLPSHATTQMISPFQESFVFATADNDDASKKDKKRRRARTCSICLSQDCPGRGGRMHCQYTKDSK
ncbi:hypothetical protein BKA69DRAFT_1049794 [Paraphysoderma sedebokerense]|nr:hypothetical protein BKA69DRAFT_1049794 [Paraphysoderma sedebokerense]